MPTTLNPAGSPTVPASIDIPSDGETLDEASITPAFQGLLDGVAALDAIQGNFAIYSFQNAWNGAGPSFPTTKNVISAVTLPTIPSGCTLLVFGVANLILVSGGVDMICEVYLDSSIVTGGITQARVDGQEVAFPFMAFTSGSGVATGNLVEVSVRKATSVSFGAAITVWATAMTVKAI